MENFSYHIPFYIVNSGIATTGHSADLTPGKVGVFDRTTFSVATSTGNGKEFFFAQGRIGGVDWYGEKVTETHKSPFFFGKDVEDMYLVGPKRLQNEEWVLGFNGAASSKGLKFEKGKPVRFKFEFNGEPTYRFFGGPKTYVVSYTPKVDCTEPCTGDCVDNALDCLTHTEALINEINTHTELRKFGVSAKLKTDTYSAATPNMEKFTLKVCDNGDSLALNAVQAQYPTKGVVRVARLDSVSTYEFCQPDGTDPVAFAQSGSVSVAVCGSCTSLAGSVASPAQDVWYIRRPLAGSETLVTSNDKQTYADAVSAAYFGKTFNATSGLDDTTETITINTHGFSDGQAVVVTVDSGLIATGLTAGVTYYVRDAATNTFKLAATRGGAAINLTDAVGVNRVTPDPTVFIAQDGAVAIIKVSVPTGTTVAGLLSDTVEFSHTTDAICEFAAPASIAWVAAGTGIRSKRTLKIEGLVRPDCDANGDRLADLTDILSGVAGIDIGTLTKIAGTACADDYTVEQFSTDCLDESCLTSNVTFTYADLPAFEGRSWNLIPVVVVDNLTRKCGILVTAGYIDPKFGNCSFDPTDYYETMPITMEVSLLVEDAGTCDNALLPTITQTRRGQISRASGEWVLREAAVKLDAYQKDQDQFSLSPRMREAFDMNIINQVDRNSFYKLYYISYSASYGTKTTWRKGEQEKFTTIFAVREDDPIAATFESQVLSVLTAKSGVVLRRVD